ncbi:hypothetical protein ACFW04_013929 [Cataglyphis niger]
MSYQAMEIKLRYNRNRWKIITIYSQDVEEITREQIQEKKEKHLVAEEKIKMIVEGDRTKSDHVSLEVELERPETNIIRQERKTKVIENSNWTEKGRENYHDVTKDYKIWCKEERKKHEKEEKEEKINNIRIETEAWKYINKYGKKRERIDEGIKLEIWKNYFMDFTELKMAEAPREDGIENEVWRYMPKKIGEVLWKLLNRIISLIYKKGEKSEVKNYRKVTLMDTTYKIYAGILNKQFRFRAGRGTVDAVYVLNYMINNELRKKGGNIFVFFADLRAAFDKIDRKKLNERMEKIRKKFWTMMYADGMVLLAKNEKVLKEMLKRFKKYLEVRELVLSPEKSKIMVFENGRGRKKNRKWKWGEESINEVKEIFDILPTLSANYTSHLYPFGKERFKRAMIAMKKTWNIKEKLFKNDYRRRAKMFDALVGNVALYGENAKLHFSRRDKNDKTKNRSNEKVIKYEEKERNSDKKIVIKCIKNFEKERKKENKWEATRTLLKKKNRNEKRRIKKKREERNQEINPEGYSKFAHFCRPFLRNLFVTISTWILREGRRCLLMPRVVNRSRKRCLARARGDDMVARHLLAKVEFEIVISNTNKRQMVHKSLIDLYPDRQCLLQLDENFSLSIFNTDKLSLEFIKNFEHI